MSHRYLISLADVPEDGLHDVKIFYEGDFNHGMWGKFKVTAQHLKKAVANFSQKIGAPLNENKEPELPVNYDHLGGENAGIIKSLYLSGKELYAKIWWTEDARKKIKEKKYRWVSPEFNENWKDENDKKHGFTVLGLALTNYPFLKKGQVALALSDNDRLILTMPEDGETFNKEVQMNKETLEILGLDENVEEKDIQEAVIALKEKSDQVIGLEAERDDLKGKLSEKESEVKTLSEGGDARVKALEEKVEAMKPLIEDGQQAKKKLHERDVNDAIQKYKAEGKITPASEDNWRKLADQDLVMFNEIMEAKGVEVDLNEHGSGGDNDLEGSNDQKADKLAKELMNKNEGMTYTEAIKKVFSENPELGKEYS